MTRDLIILNVWIGNLAMYNAGILHGEWVDMTSDFETIKEVSNLISNGGQDEIFIADYESDFNIKVDEYDSLEEIRERIEMYTDLVDAYADYAADILDAVTTHTSHVEEQRDIICGERFRIYTDCSTMSAVAEQILEETGELDSLPDFARRYFDFEAYGRDLDIEGYFYYTSNNVYVEIY
ncbi:MAG: antirestriction protein ArdA [bacterium]|nr:antirestriction protein ArdA [bacterium]